MDADLSQNSQTDEKVLREARDRFKKCREWESSARVKMMDDVRFGNGSATDLAQWPDQIVTARMQADKPILSLNKVRQFCLNIINDARQHKPGIKINPVGSGASYESAMIYESIIRHIEANSNAQQAYDNACWWQVFAGIGWFRVVTDYSHDDTMDQEVFIRRVPDAMSIYMDPHISEYDGSDARYLFAYRDVEKDQWEAEYPKYRDIGENSPLSDDDGSVFVTEDTIRVCEYWRKVDVEDVLHVLDNGDTVRESSVKDADLLDQLNQHTVANRPITSQKVEMFLIAGNKVIEHHDWPGRFIPFCRVLGEEVVLDRRLDRRGHVRHLLDAQRTYNYMSSAAVEHVALQSKSPYVAPVAAIESFEKEWREANIVNLSVLPYNHMDDDGREIPRPAREQPPAYAPAYLEGMKVAAQEMEMVSGQYASVLGQPSNERSGKAINERQRAALNSTYHFVDHLSSAIRFCGKILIDLLPKVLDTRRVIKIMAIDGTPGTVQVDPNMPASHLNMPQGVPNDGESIDPQHISAVWNPSVGLYSVQSDVGPSFQTQRLEAFNALSDIMSQNESLAPMIMDLWARNSDFPDANIIAERFRRMLPPAASGQTNPQLEQAQQHIAQQSQIMQQMAQELQQAKNELQQTKMKADLEIYKAETQRLAAVGAIDPLALRPVVRQLVSEVLGGPANLAIGAHVAEDAAMHHAVGVQSPHASPIAPSPQEQAQAGADAQMAVNAHQQEIAPQPEEAGATQ
jgi:hypothetical protein